MRYLAVIAGLALAVLASPWAQSANETLAKTVKVDIRPQKVSTALIELSHQAGIQVLMPGELVEALDSNGARGEMTLGEVISKLLEGTNLGFREVGENAIGIELRTAAHSASNASVGSLRLAQTNEGSADAASKDCSLPENRSDPSCQLQELDLSAIPEILVRGSRTLNLDIKRSRDGSQPYVIFEREILERSGASNVDEFLKEKLPMASGGIGGRSTNQNGTGRSNSIVDLRGLGFNQTLILIDGHRTSSRPSVGNALQPELNGIPLSAIERIEVLPASAAGIYGGSATGGVINVVLRRDYDRTEVKLGYEGTFDGGGVNRRADMSTGFNFEGGRTNLLLNGSYSDANPLLLGDRDFARRGRARVLVNNPEAYLPGFSPPFGATTNICSGTFFCDGTPLTLKGGAALGASFVSIPAGYSGVSSDNGAQLAGRAGQYNFELPNTTQAGGRGQSLLSAPTTTSVSATLRRDMGMNIQAFLDLSVSRLKSSVITNGASSILNLAATDPGNPFEQDVLVTTPAFAAEQFSRADTRHHRALAGLIFKLPREWQGEVDYTWDRTRESFASAPNGLTALVDGITAAEAVAAGSLDVFRDTNASPIDFTPYVGDVSLFIPEADSTLRDATLRLSGPIVALPGGKLTLTTLLEHRKESLGEGKSVFSGLFEFLFPSRNQAVDSIYVESRLPLIGTENGMPGVRLLELQLAARHERYKTEGANTLVRIGGAPFDPALRSTNRVESTDPTLGLLYKPSEDLSLRATYSTGFLPPAMNQVFASPGLYSAEELEIMAAQGVTDPLRGDEPVGGGAGIVELSGGNPNLKPEESKSWSVGFILAPRFAPGLRISVDRIVIDKTDNITAPFGFFPASFSNSIFNYEDLVPGLVTRGPASGGHAVGPVTAINTGLFNIARQEVEAYDLALDYRLDTNSLGVWTLSAAGTRQVHNKQQVLPDNPTIENAGVSSALGFSGGLRWRGNAGLSWDYRQWSMAWTTTYFSKYWLLPERTIYPDQGSATVPRQVYHDLFARYRLAPAAFRWLGDVEIQLGVKNIFNRAPPFDATGGDGFYYSFFGDPRQARYSLGIRTSF
jgi:iron complex outermembrane recepter protein